MFVTFVMDPLVKEYKKLLTPDLVSNTPQYREARMKIKNLFSKWMPMEKGILGMVVQHLPAPTAAQKNRASIFCPALVNEADKTVHKNEQDYLKLKNSVLECNNSADEPVVAYITKMQPFSSRIYDVLTRASSKSAES